MKKPANLPLEISNKLYYELSGRGFAATANGEVRYPASPCYPCHTKENCQLAPPRADAALAQYSEKQDQLEAIEKELAGKGFTFEFSCCFARKVGKDDAHELRIYRSEGATPTAALYLNEQEVARWPMWRRR